MRTILTPAASVTVTATDTGTALTAPAGGVTCLIYIDATAAANDVSLVLPSETAHSARRVAAGTRGGPFGPYDPEGVWPELYAATSTTGVVVSYDQVASE